MGAGPLMGGFEPIVGRAQGFPKTNEVGLVGIRFAHSNPVCIRHSEGKNRDWDVLLAVVPSVTGLSIEKLDDRIGHGQTPCADMIPMNKDIGAWVFPITQFTVT